MQTKEYIVSLNRNVDYDQFWNEIENESVLDGFVPDRRVEIINNRDVSLRQCHYALTDDEASRLRNDPRIYSVEEPTKFKPFRYAIQQGNFDKTSSDAGNFLNWGLRRCISDTNVYGTTASAAGDYTYSLDGTGVDVVIQDSGLQVDHPEFQNASGVSRVQEIDWYTASGVIGTMPANHYRDYDGHGTHVGGIAAGKTYGWAKNANIYSVKVAGLEGGGDSGTGLDAPDCFDVIIGWHNNKPIDPVTGFKRPTIVNMSWGYGDYFTNINGGSYRGTPWAGTARRTDLGMIGFFDGFNNRHVVRVGYIDVSVQEMIDAGIHVCIAAGNSSQKCDVTTGTDYNNYYVGGYFNGANPNYYHRGGSPYDDEAFVVGCIDSDVFDANQDQKATFSETGPAVNIWAPGSDIMSCTSTVNSWGFNSQDYYANSAYSQTNISGTSMASPQVCGVGALFLQLEPSLSPAQLRDKITKNTKATIYSTGLDNDYTNNRSLLASNIRMLFNPFNSAENFRITGGLSSSSGV